MRAIFDTAINDGAIRCEEIISQPYANAAFSAGLVKGIEPDTLYLQFSRDGEEPWTVFLRPDEALAIVWVLSGSLWSKSMMEMDDVPVGNVRDGVR